MSNNAVIPFLVGMMLLTGVCNTLLTKYQDLQCVRNCDSPNPKDRQTFEQPVWQTIQMFIGESGCWLVVAISAVYNRFAARKASGYEPVAAQSRTVDASTSDGDGDVGDGYDADGLRGNSTEGSDVEPVAKPLVPNAINRQPLTGWRVILLAIPASCDIAGTTLMNIGLLFVAASIYQMTRGALVLFVGLFSVLFLRSRLGIYKWVALFIVVAGVALVGLAGIVERGHAPNDKTPGQTPPNSPPSSGLDRDDSLLHMSLLVARDALADNAALQTFVGILLIFGAQVFTASQFVIEEAIMHRYSMMPISVVGWEGVFGLAITLLVLAVGHLTYGMTDVGRGGYFDATQGWRDMTQHATIGITSLLIMVSIGGFNFFGLSVTRSVSATSRSTIDTCRTLFIWVVSLGLGWETFKWLQVLGFAMLVYGTFLFNDIVRPPKLGRFLCCSQTRRPADASHQDLLPERASLDHN